MPGIGTPHLRTPRPLYSRGDLGIRAHGSRVILHPDDTSPYDIGVGSWVVASTNGYISVDGVGGTPTSGGGDYRVTKLYSADGVELDFQYLTVAELGAATYYADVQPLGGIDFEATEDGDTTPIAEADSGKTVAAYANLIITNIAAAVLAALKAANPFGGASVLMEIDSTSITSSAGSTMVRVKGPARGADNPVVSATAGSQRNFVIAARSAGQSQ
jgi:hypothetical protein